jgi:uncharacterized protein YeaO (DUF488 family)
MNNIKIYDTLADLIFKGFLTIDLNLKGTHLILKTVNDKEFDLIKMYSGDPKSKSYQLRFNIYFLIFSLFMINNKNVLCDRQQSIPDLYDYFLNLPGILSQKLLISLNSLREETLNCLKCLEGFSYTSISRSTWKALNGHLPCSTEFTGIPGTADLGVNVHQESWVIINKSLDEEELYNKDFSLALMITSASNAKGARTIRGQFDSAKKMAEDRRKKLAKVGFIEKKDWKADGWSASVDTVEELVAELDRQMSGVKDRHDLFMEKFMNQTREQAEKRTREAQEHISQAKEGYNNLVIDGEHRAMTDAEVRALSAPKRIFTETVQDELVNTEDKNRFLTKIGARVLTAK